MLHELRGMKPRMMHAFTYCAVPVYIYMCMAMKYISSTIISSVFTLVLMSAYIGLQTGNPHPRRLLSSTPVASFTHRCTTGKNVIHSLAIYHVHNVSHRPINQMKKHELNVLRMWYIHLHDRLDSELEIGGGDIGGG